MLATTGLSGNELYCITKKGFKAGTETFGNSLHSIEVIKSLESGTTKSLADELPYLTKLIKEARLSAYQPFQITTNKNNTVIIGINPKLLHYKNHLEFLFQGSTLYAEQMHSFTTHLNGQALYVALDAGFIPVTFVFDTLVYSLKPYGFFTNVKNLKAGEIMELSHKLNQLYEILLENLLKQAQHKANSIIGIEIDYNLFADKACEILVTGTACSNDFLMHQETIATSHLSAFETWSLAKMGYAPLCLMVKTAVYSLGVVEQLTTPWSMFNRKENTVLTKIIHDARLKNLTAIQAKAKAIAADEVLGLKYYISHLGNGLIEVLSLGTAIKKIPQIKTQSKQLPTEAIISEINYIIDPTHKIMTEHTLLSALSRITVILLILSGLIWLYIRSHV